MANFTVGFLSDNALKLPEELSSALEINTHRFAIIKSKLVNAKQIAPRITCPVATSAALLLKIVHIPKPAWAKIIAINV
jgi:hypothetical protein